MNFKRFIKTAVLATGLFLFTPILADAATHTVVKGDTLYSIAKKYNTSVETIKSENNLKSNTIKIGQTLNFSNSKATASTAKAESVVKVSSYKTYRMIATAFTANCRGCSGVTATGINLKKNPNAKVVAVDPKVIPLGSKVHVQGYGTAVAGDTGGGIKGKKIDVFYSSTKSAYNWGRRTVTVKVYGS